MKVSTISTAMLLSLLMLAPVYAETCSAIFSGEHQKKGSSVWISDGTSKGTKLLKDLYAGITYSDDPKYFTSIKDRKLVVFSGRSTQYGRELYVTDGTSAGTKIVKDIYGGASFSSEPEGRDGPFFQAGKKAIFIAEDYAHGPTFWSTDGTPAGTKRLPKFGKPVNSFPALLATNGKKVLLRGADPIQGEATWLTNGSSISYIVPGETSDRAYLKLASSLGTNRFLFLRGNDLWVTDGTSKGTKFVKDMTVYHSRGDILEMAGFQSKPFAVMSAAGKGIGYELFRSDGTAAGTVLIKNIMLYDSSSYPEDFFEFGKQIFFSAISDGSGRELWVTDGTGPGTKKVAEIAPGAASSNPSEFLVFNGELVFTAFKDYKKGLYRYSPKTKKVVQIGKPYLYQIASTPISIGSKVLFSLNNFSNSGTYSVDKKWKIAKISSTFMSSDAAVVCRK